MPYQREKKRKEPHKQKQKQSQSSKNVININVGGKGGGGVGGGGGTKKRRTGGGGGGGGGGGPMNALAFNQALAMSAPHTNYVPIMLPQQQQQEQKVVQPQQQQDNTPSFWDQLQQSIGMGIANRIAYGGGGTTTTNHVYHTNEPAPVQRPAPVQEQDVARRTAGGLPNQPANPALRRQQAAAAAARRAQENNLGHFQIIDHAPAARRALPAVPQIPAAPQVDEGMARLQNLARRALPAPPAPNPAQENNLGHFQIGDDAAALRALQARQAAAAAARRAQENNPNLGHFLIRDDAPAQENDLGHFLIRDDAAAARRALPAVPQIPAAPQVDEGMARLQNLARRALPAAPAPIAQDLHDFLGDGLEEAAVLQHTPEQRARALQLLEEARQARRLRERVEEKKGREVKDGSGREVKDELLRENYGTPAVQQLLDRTSSGRHDSPKDAKDILQHFYRQGNNYVNNKNEKILKLREKPPTHPTQDIELQAIPNTYSRDSPMGDRYTPNRSKIHPTLEELKQQKTFTNTPNEADLKDYERSDSGRSDIEMYSLNALLDPDSPEDLRRTNKIDYSRGAHPKEGVKPTQQAEKGPFFRNAELYRTQIAAEEKAAENAAKRKDAAAARKLTNQQLAAKAAAGIEAAKGRRPAAYNPEALAAAAAMPTKKPAGKPKPTGKPAGPAKFPPPRPPKH